MLAQIKDGLMLWGLRLQGLRDGGDASSGIDEPKLLQNMC